MNFRKYQHIERFGNDEVQDIEIGISYVFPKIDGTNASVWNVEGDIKGGSRNRELSLENDNAGFYAYVLENEKIKAYMNKYPNHRLYGEWLVKHTISTYRKDAWRKFYVFDVAVDKDDDVIEYLPYDVYKEMLEEFEIDYIMPLAKIKNGSYENFIHVLNQNVFLIEDGAGIGEGVVIKNYSFYNKYGRQTWAKIVTSEFKEKHYKTMGCPETDMLMTEEKIVNEVLTEALIEKEYQKIVLAQGGWKSQYIPMLLGIVQHEFIVEEIWNILKTYKNPTINFRTLNTFIIAKVKEVKSDLFR